MRLSTEQIAQFDREGYLFFPALFSREEIKTLTTFPMVYAGKFEQPGPT